MSTHDRTRIPDHELVSMARRGMDELERVDEAHVASLWDAIDAQAFAPEARADDDASATSPAASTEPPRQARRLAAAPDLPVQDDPDPAGVAPTSGDSSIVRLDDRRARRERMSPMAWMAAAAAAFVLVVGGVWIVNQPTTRQVATFAMQPLDDRVATEIDGGIVEDGDSTIVEVDLSALPELDGGEFYELWLLDLDNEQLVSLGEVDPTTTAVPIDAPVNATAFPVIDVSVEPADGEPTHSGDSVLRGPITAADATN